MLEILLTPPLRANLLIAGFVIPERTSLSFDLYFALPKPLPLPLPAINGIVNKNILVKKSDFNEEYFKKVNNKNYDGKMNMKWGMER